MAAKSRKNFIEKQIVEELRKSNSTLSTDGTIMYNGKEYKTNQMVKTLDKNYKGPNIRIKTLIQNINENPTSTDHASYFQPRKETYQPIRPSTVKQGSASEMTPDEFKRTIKDFLMEGKDLSQQDRTLNQEFKQMYKRDIIAEAENEFYIENKDEIDKQLEQTRITSASGASAEENLKNQYENAPEGNTRFDENVPLITPGSDIKKIVKDSMADSKTQQIDQLEIEKKAIEDWKKEKAQDLEMEKLKKEKERQYLLELMPVLIQGIEHKAMTESNFSYDDLSKETKEIFNLIDYTYGTDPAFDKFRQSNLKQSIEKIRPQKEPEKNIAQDKPMSTLPPKITDISTESTTSHKQAEYGQGSGLAGVLLDKVPLPGGPVGTAVKWGTRAAIGTLEESLLEGEDPLAGFLPGRDQSETAQNVMQNQGMEGTMTANVPESFATDTSPIIVTQPVSVDFDLTEFVGGILPPPIRQANIGVGQEVISGGPGPEQEMMFDPPTEIDSETQTPATFETSIGEERADMAFNRFSQPGTYVGTISPAEQPRTIMPPEGTITEQDPNSMPTDQGLQGQGLTGPTYKNAIHKNALIVYFGSYEKPNWDWKLWTAYEGLDIGQNKSFFLNTTRSLFALHGTDLLIDSLVYNENSSAQQVFQEYMEVIELYKCFAGINSCSSSNDIVKIPKNDYDSIVSTLSTGNLPIQDSINNIANNLKSKKMNKKQAMDELSKLVKFKREKVIKDEFMDKKVLNTISNYELKQMLPTDIPRQYRKMWNGVPQIYNPTKIEQISDRIGRDTVPAIDNLNKGQIIMPKPNSIYVPAKGQTKKMRINVEIPKD